MHRSIAKTVAPTLTLVALVAAILGACSDESSTSADPAELTLTFSPATVTAQSSPRAGFDFRASFTVQVTETAGVGATITSINSTLYESAGGIIVGTPDQGEDVVAAVSAATNRIDAFGTATIGFTIDYRLNGGGREALVDVTVQIEDDNDRVVSETERVGVV